jgi:hypothetical protein
MTAHEERANVWLIKPERLEGGDLMVFIPLGVHGRELRALLLHHGLNSMTLVSGVLKPETNRNETHFCCISKHAERLAGRRLVPGSFGSKI